MPQLRKDGEPLLGGQFEEKGKEEAHVTEPIEFSVRIDWEYDGKAARFVAFPWEDEINYEQHVCWGVVLFILRR